MTKKSIGARNKQKGSHAERFYFSLFKELGYPKCVTARLGSRLHDNAGIDLINIPYNIQIKAGVQKNLSPGKVLLNMKVQIDSLFTEDSPVRGYPLLLIHRPLPFSATTDADVVYMCKAQFDIFNKDSDLEPFIIELKKRKNKMNNAYGEIISLPFNSLKDKLTPQSVTVSNI